MSRDKEKMTKEEKLKKAAELIENLNELELSDDDMKEIIGGMSTWPGYPQRPWK